MLLHTLRPPSARLQPLLTSGLSGPAGPRASQAGPGRPAPLRSPPPSSASGLVSASFLPPGLEGHPQTPPPPSRLASVGKRRGYQEKHDQPCCPPQVGMALGAGACPVSLRVQAGFTLPRAHLGLGLVPAVFLCSLFSFRGCSPLSLRGWGRRGVLRWGLSFLLELCLLSRLILAPLSRPFLLLLETDRHTL